MSLQRSLQNGRQGLAGVQWTDLPQVGQETTVAEDFFFIWRLVALGGLRSRRTGLFGVRQGSGGGSDLIQQKY